MLFEERTNKVNMTAVSRQDIVGTRFEKRRRGYDPEAVDEFLRGIAQHIEELETQLAGQATDKTALDLLKKAERIAHDTRLGAEIDANRERATAAGELEQARLTAAGIVQDGKNEAARLIDEANAQAAAIHQAAALQSSGMKQDAAKVGEFITESAGDLRLGARRLAAMADQFEAELAKRGGSAKQAAPAPSSSAAPITPPDTATTKTNGHPKNLFT